MKSLADGLPPEIARQIHADWRKNEADYWAVRDQLLAQYRNQWIGFANGSVIISGTNPAEVLDAVLSSDQHPFFTRVGREQEPWCRMRRAIFPYDATYAGVPLPVLTVEFRVQPGSSGLILNQVIPDTGADASALPWSDCQQLGLNPAAGAPVMMAGVGQTAVQTVAFKIWVHLDGRDYSCRLHVDVFGDERLLGRDVLNQLDVLFRGPAREVVVNP